MKTEAKLIGLTGTNGAGKGEVAAYLIKKGYAYFSLSDIIREELEKKGQEITRDNLIKLGNGLRKEFGADILARRVMEKLKGKAVIDSIRNPKEIEYLRKQRNFVLLGIDAPVKLRYERVKKRGRNESSSTLREFIQKEREEMQGFEHGQQILKCLEMADFRIINDGSLESLYQKLEEFL
jgi:dephospho-CoA kinase